MILEITQLACVSCVCVCVFPANRAQKSSSPPSPRATSGQVWHGRLNKPAFWIQSEAAAEEDDSGVDRRIYTAAGEKQAAFSASSFFHAVTQCNASCGAFLPKLFQIQTNALVLHRSQQRCSTPPYFRTISLSLTCTQPLIYKSTEHEIKLFNHMLLVHNTLVMRAIHFTAGAFERSAK